MHRDPDCGLVPAGVGAGRALASLESGCVAQREGHPSSSQIGHEAPIAYDPATTAQLDWEVELAVVIGRSTRNVVPGDALGSVFGYTCSNDVSGRDVQLGESQWVRGKSLRRVLPARAMGGHCRRAARPAVADAVTHGQR